MPARSIIEATERLDPSHKLKFKDRLGQCYVLAGRYASHHEDATLVHGSIEGFGNPRIDHAWVELPGDEVFEPTSGMTLPASVFAEIYHPEAHARFDWEETLKQTLRQQHWGPWNGVLAGDETTQAQPP